MYPWSVSREFADEHCAGDGAAAFSAADVLNVGERTLDEFAVFLVHGHLPHFFAGRFGAGEKLVGPDLIVAKNAGVDVGECDDDGPREGGGIHQVGGSELFGIVNTVGKNQAAFGVGVQDLDGFAGHGGLNVTGLLRFAAGHIFSCGNHADHFNIWLKSRESAHHAEHGGSASHVVLHFFHAIGGLDGDAAGVESDGPAAQAAHGRAAP